MGLKALEGFNNRTISAAGAGKAPGPESSLLKIKGTQVLQELNDIARRAAGPYATPDLPETFFADWLRVADDEARHFLMLRHRLQTLDADYGDLPAHDGLWEAALTTKDDLLARLAIVPLIMEARGLDTTPVAG